MTHLRKLFAAAVLTFILVGATHANDGIIYGGLMPAPSPTPAKTSSYTGEEPPAPDPSGDEVTVTDIVIETTLGVIGEMLLLY